MFTKKISSLLILFSLSLFPFSCTLDSLSTQLIGHYSGNLPCADCPGIIMNLDLKEKSQYNSEMIYIERNVTVTESGIWKISKEKDSHGIERSIIELTSENSKAKTYFNLKNNTTLQLLDSENKPVPSADLKKKVS